MYEIGIEKNGPGMASEGSITVRQGFGSPQLVADVVTGDDGEALARLVRLANLGLAVESNLDLIDSALDSYDYWEHRDELPHDSGFITILDDEDFARQMAGRDEEELEAAQEAWDAVKASRALASALTEWCNEVAA